MLIKPFRNYWVCVGKHGFPDQFSISFKRNTSISYFLGNSFTSWEEAKKAGWQCVKVNITIEAVEKPKPAQEKP